jgi:lysophospholipase L1-like esterase
MVMVNKGSTFRSGKPSVDNPSIASSPFHGCEIKESAFSASLMNEKSLPSRRDLFKTGGLALAATAIANTVLGDHHKTKKHPASVQLNKGDVVLFQGDSITDAGRDKRNQVANEHKAFGRGYAWLAASQLLVNRPELELTIHNRGISGNKVHQLAGRWDKDCLELKPNALSVLIGVNDIWHGLNGRYDGTVETYETDFMKLLERTRKALPKVNFIVCEPFVLKCGAVNEKWFPEFDKYRASARKVSDEHGAVFVPFQSMFDEAVKIAPPNHWAGDGVHPSQYGAALMANFWLQAVAG